MASEQQGFRRSFPVNSDLSALQYTFVKLSSGNLAGCGANDPMLGILQDKPTATIGVGSVMYAGESRLTVDGSGTSIAAGDPLESGSGGVGVKSSTNGHEVGAMALAAATTAGAIIPVLIVRYRY